MKKLSIKIVGPAGFGIKVTGITIAKVFMRLGLNVFAYTEYPSLIRGGHNTYQIDLSKDKVHSSNQKCNILIALTKEAIQKEKENIELGGIVICDKSIINEEDLNLRSIKTIKAPLIESAKFAGSELMKNTVALGVLLSLLDLSIKNLNNVLADIFASKKEVIKDNKVAAKTGYDWMEQFKKKENSDFDKLSKIVSVSKKGSNNVLMTGNQACAMSVIASQCQMYVAYPMTPSTDILHILEAEQKETGMLIHQPEDEISGIHVALGSSFTGARSAVGTSGGGFALMNEGFSLAGMTETPLVVFEVMRPAPATGNPTWSDQGDLGYVVNAGHGEFAKIVITPGTPEQSFNLVQHAFNLADKYQTPVVILSDKHLGESSFTVSKEVFNEVDKIDRGKIVKSVKQAQEIFMRYKVEKDGISARTIPGIQNGEHIANSDEHDEYGYSDESSKVRIQQMDKRMKKLDEIKKDIPLPKVYGPKIASKTLVCWGSSFGACKDTVDNNKDINLINFEYVYPMPNNLDKFLKKFRKLILVEQNKTGQLGKLIRQETGIQIKDKILKYDSRPFWSDEVLSLLSS
ncbi:MAG: 2-oxoacid:acceptor oxidoreductase subunit alpha [Patescibacteria group bacterium]